MEISQSTYGDITKRTCEVITKELKSCHKRTLKLSKRTCVDITRTCGVITKTLMELSQRI